MNRFCVEPPLASPGTLRRRSASSVSREPIDLGVRDSRKAISGDARYHRRIGPLNWRRYAWMAALFEFEGRTFGLYWDRLSSELVLIFGCRLVCEPQNVRPWIFAGGWHVTLPLSVRGIRGWWRGLPGRRINGPRIARGRLGL